MNDARLSIGEFRSISIDMLDTVLEWRNAPKVRANMYTRHEISRQEHHDWWNRVAQASDKRYVLYQRGSEPLGVVGVTNIDRENGHACWAFYASPEAPPGTGSRMEFLALDYVFRELRLHKLYCEVLSFNTPVIKLHLKFGFQVEGTFREQHKTDEGFVDIVRLGMLAQEWETSREKMFEKLTQQRGG